MSEYLLTIYIVHFRRLPQLKKTVENLRKNTNIKYKLKILNNGYIDDEIKNYLAELEKQEGIEVIYSNENIGASRGRAMLVENINTPYLLSLDDDMYVDKDWDIPIFEKFNSDSEVNAIGFILSEDNGKTWFACGKKFKINKNILQILRTKVDVDDMPDYIKVDDIGSGAILYEREIMDVVKWDPFYFVGFEDLQKGIYLYRNKCKCLISTRSKIIHDKLSKSPKYKQYNKMRRDYNSIRKSYLYFVKKNDLRLDYKRHFFHKYFCLLPNPIARSLIFGWLYVKDRLKIK